MRSPEELVEHSDRLTRIFGGWPSFHDAEVIRVELWRGDVDPLRESWVFPTVTVTLQLMEAKSEPDEPMLIKLRPHTRVTLCFHGVEEDLALYGLNHQNQIYGLSIAERQRDNGPSPYLAVTFKPGFGLGAAFRCRRVEVQAVAPCSPRDVPPGEP